MWSHHTPLRYVGSCLAPPFGSGASRPITSCAGRGTIRSWPSCLGVGLASGAICLHRPWLKQVLPRS